MNNKHRIVCFGETLWDVFPGSREPGGAPMNVAVHLALHGEEVQLISRVGNDEPGRELIAFMRRRGVNTAALQVDTAVATGMVKVILDPGKENAFEIVYPSAWDFISFTPEMTDVAGKAGVFIYGSLASRNTASASTLLRLLPLAGLKVMDLNLREPYYRLEELWQLIAEADILKINQDEMLFLGRQLDMDTAGAEAFCRRAAECFSLKQVIITRAEDGAVVLDEGVFYSHPGYQVEVVNTVGSGDAFLAAYLVNQLRARPVAECLAYACAAGALVATAPGANPEYSEEDVKTLYNLNNTML